MRRRLSVAMACIGNPDILILDEPTTGLDPASRRQVWEVIENIKVGRSVVLTTHAMEEADYLCTRIGGWIGMCQSMYMYIHCTSSCSKVKLGRLVTHVHVCIQWELVVFLFCVCQFYFVFLGIMNFGRLCCVGSQSHLKNKFGTGYELKFHCASGRAANVERFVQTNLKEAVHIETYAGLCTFTHIQYYVSIDHYSYRYMFVSPR